MSGDYDFDLSNVQLSDEAAGAVGESGMAATGNIPTLAEFGDIARTGAPAGGGGNFWSKLSGDVSGGIKDAGSLAKAALPLASLGATVAGPLLSMRAMDQNAKQGKIVTDAEKVQIQNAQKGQEIAPRVEAFAPQVAAVAPKIQDTARTMRTAVADPLTGFGGSQLKLAAEGKIPEAQEAEIQRWAQQQKAIIQQWFAHSGLGDSTMLKEALADIDKQAVGMRTQAIQAEEALGTDALSRGGSALGGEVGADQAAAGVLATAAGVERSAADALGVSAGAAGGAARSAEAQQQALQKLIADSEQMLAKLNAGS